MEDCRKDKELKQSTCRYVKKCDPGWTRNEKFICRKTTRRLRNNDTNVHFENKNANALSNLEDKEDNETKRNKKRSVRSNGNQFSQNRSRKNKSKKSKQSKKSRKAKVGNYITYTHPNGRKERAQIMKIRPEDGAYELYIPSLANEWAGPDFKKNEIVYYIYKTGMREKATILKVVEEGELYDIHLHTTNEYKTVTPTKLRKLYDYPDTVPKGSALSTLPLGTKF